MSITIRGRQDIHSYSCSGRAREDQVQFTSNVDDEELPKWYGGEEAEKGTHDGDGEDAAEVVLGVI